MRLSTHRVKHNLGMLTMNYIVCALLAGMFEEYWLSWVPDFCDPDSPYSKAYGEMLEASWRICERLGKDAEDDDVECMRNAYEEMQDLVAWQMFVSGIVYAEMRNKERPVG